ncbi:MAG: cobalamin-dependent protein [Desulfobacterales bacterium]|nr:cobalamin-dependent protein [Desulfobacterales bacterium]MBF0396004.1 cobalamin-dependent protein [Desulfobacterales bacterium]
MKKEKRVFLVYPSFPSGLFPSISPALLSLAAYAAQYNPNFIVRIWDERIDGPFDPGIAKDALVCITAMTAQASRTKYIAKKVKQVGAYDVVFGGIHPTACPEEFLEYGSVVQGEIEGGSFTNVLSDYNEGRLLAKKYFTPPGSLENLLLAPDRFYEYAAKLSDNMISDGRGCPLGCSYCSIHIISGKTDIGQWKKL